MPKIKDNVRPIMRLKMVIFNFFSLISSIIQGPRIDLEKHLTDPGIANDHTSALLEGLRKLRNKVEQQEILINKLSSAEEQKEIHLDRIDSYSSLSSVSWENKNKKVVEAEVNIME